MKPFLISQFAADERANLMASATQQHLTRQAGNVHQTAARPRGLAAM